MAYLENGRWLCVAGIRRGRSEGHETDEIDRGPHCEGPQVRWYFPCSSALPYSLP